MSASSRRPHFRESRIRGYTVLPIFVGCLENQFHIALDSLTSSESCQNCPANSTSPGGFASYCTCVEGYGRKMSMNLFSDCEGVHSKSCTLSVIYSEYCVFSI